VQSKAHVALFSHFAKPVKKNAGLSSRPVFPCSGVQVSFVAQTIRVGKMVNPPYNYTPTTGEGLADLQKMQEAIWGRLGY
jgi:hypothetical protein